MTPWSQRRKHAAVVRGGRRLRAETGGETHAIRLAEPADAKVASRIAVDFEDPHLQHDLL